MTQQSDPDVWYEKTSDYEWTARAYELLLAGRLTVRVMTSDAVSSAVIKGPCPRCTHHMTDRRLLTAVTDMQGDDRSGGPQGIPGPRYMVRPSVPSLVLDVTCSCGTPHAGPDGKAEAGGCGASFRIELAPAALVDPAVLDEIVAEAGQAFADPPGTADPAGSTADADANPADPEDPASPTTGRP